ncbi:MAG: DUF499 domain-containing protein [Betaproteobacteria bacterium]|nr:DUF499 domain-containing protein [Betaproteobacteria bacterium]
MASSTDSGAVLRLSTGFGGGKTHALMTLWHLAKTIADPTMGTDLLPPAGRPAAVRVVGIDAEGAGYPVFARHGDQEARSLAAELAFQFGGASALNALGSANATAASPDAATVEALLPNEPVLILLDELVLYMAKLTDQEVGNLVGFLRTLMTAIVGRKHAVLVITDPKDQPADAANAARLEHLAHVIEQQTGRQATVIEPIGNETAQVIIRRLFDQVDHAAAAKASADHFKLYERVAEEHPNLILCFGVEKGPPWRGDRRPKGTPLMTGFTMAPWLGGSLDWDAGGGDGRENPPGVFRAGEADQGDLPGAAAFAEGCAEGSAI